jgi:hypothetical protein
MIWQLDLYRLCRAKSVGRNPFSVEARKKSGARGSGVAAWDSAKLNGPPSKWSANLFPIGVSYW